MFKSAKPYRFASWLLVLSAFLILLPLGLSMEYAAYNFGAFAVFALTGLGLRLGRLGALGLLVSGLGLSFGIWGFFQFQGASAIAFGSIAVLTFLAYIIIFGALWRGRRNNYA